MGRPIFQVRNEHTRNHYVGTTYHRASGIRMLHAWLPWPTQHDNTGDGHAQSSHPDFIKMELYSFNQYPLHIPSPYFISL